MHLAEVKGLSDAAGTAMLQRLFKLNIRHVEQLGSLLASPEGRYALQRLGIEVEKIQLVVEPALGRVGLSLSNPLKPGTALKSLITRERFPMGYTAGTRDPFREVTFDTALPDPPRAVDPIPPTLPAPCRDSASADPTAVAMQSGISRPRRAIFRSRPRPPWDMRRIFGDGYVPTSPAQGRTDSASAIDSVSLL